MESGKLESEGNIELQSYLPHAQIVEEGKYSDTDLFNEKETFSSEKTEETTEKEFAGASTVYCCDKPYKRCLWIVIPLLLVIIFVILFLYFYVLHPLLNSQNPTMDVGEVTVSGLSLGGIFGGTRVVTLKADVVFTNHNPFDLYIEESKMTVHYPTLDGPVIGTIKMEQQTLKAKEEKTIGTQTRLVDFPPPGDETIDLIYNSGILGEPLTMYSTGESVAYAQVKLFNWYAKSQSAVTCELETYLTEPSKDSQVCSYKDIGEMELKYELPSEFQQ